MMTFIQDDSFWRLDSDRLFLLWRNFQYGVNFWKSWGVTPLKRTFARVPNLAFGPLWKVLPREVAQYGRNWAEVTFLSHLYKERAKLRKDALSSKETDLGLLVIICSTARNWALQPLCISSSYHYHINKTKSNLKSNKAFAFCLYQYHTMIDRYYLAVDSGHHKTWQLLNHLLSIIC